jgi:hypothetical protein
MGHTKFDSSTILLKINNHNIFLAEIRRTIHTTRTHFIQGQQTALVGLVVPYYSRENG